MAEGRQRRAATDTGLYRAKAGCTNGQTTSKVTSAVGLYCQTVSFLTPGKTFYTKCVVRQLATYSLHTLTHTHTHTHTYVGHKRRWHTLVEGQ